MALAPLSTEMQDDPTFRVPFQPSLDDWVAPLFQRAWGHEHEGQQAKFSCKYEDTPPKTDVETGAIDESPSVARPSVSKGSFTPHWRCVLTDPGAAADAALIEASGDTKAAALTTAKFMWLRCQSWWPQYAERMIVEVLRTAKFVKGERMLEEEGNLTEFKGPAKNEGIWSFKNFLQSFRNNAGRTVCGFLNRGIGGKLLFGIHDDGTIVGTALDHKERDEAKLAWTNIASLFFPALIPRQVVMSLRHVHAPDYEEQIYVIELVVKPRSTTAAPTCYFYNNDAFIRHESSTLPMKAEQIVRSVRGQMIHQLGAVGV